MASSCIPKALNQLRWNLKPSEFPVLAEQLISSYRAVLDGIASVAPEQRSFSSVVLPLAQFEADAQVTESILTFPLNVSPDPLVRDASTEAKKRLEAFQIEAQMRPDVYSAIQAYADSSPEVHALAHEDRRFLDHVLRDYRRNGLALSAEVREKNEALSKEIAELCTSISQHLNNDTSHLFLSVAQLKGLPPSLISALPLAESEQDKDKKEAEKKKEHQNSDAALKADSLDDPTQLRQVTMKYPHVIPCMQHVVDGATRALLDRKFKGRQMEENVPLAERVLRLRDEKARLLGYATSAAYTLEIEMAHDPDTVDGFYAQLMPKLLVKGAAELEVLRALKAKTEGELPSGLPEILSHDFNFYHTRLQESMGVDDQEIRQYFPLEHVVGEMLALYETLFACKFTLVSDAGVGDDAAEQGSSVWHKDVKLYAVVDASGPQQEFLGSFYMDLFPRDGKFGHAAVFPLQLGSVGVGGKVIPPCGALVCNFTQPTGDSPSLLQFSEVVTLLHEFGHQCHGLFSTAKHARFSGTNTERDFVECPSQMLEEWCYQPTVLRRLSKHHETGESLPEALIERLIRLKNLNAGLLNLRQAFFGQYDQRLHRGDLGGASTQALWHEMKRSITLVPESPDTNPLANFGHLFGGYNSRYYGYLWSEVYAAALFEKFAQAGFDQAGNCNDPSLGLRYRHEILAPGGSRDSSISLRSFLGHDPSVNPFMRSIGLDSSD